MNLDSLKIAILEEKFEALIATQQTKIDSLSMIVHDTKIAEGHFSSVLGVQTGIFSLIITIIIAGIALISWGFYYKFFKKEVRELESKTDKKIEDIETKVEDALQKIKSHEYDICKSMLVINKDKGHYFYTCLWALRLCESNKDDVEDTNSFIEYADECATKSKKEHISQSFLDEVNGQVKELSKIDGIDKEKLESIREMINKIYYTPDKKSRSLPKQDLSI